MVLHILPGVLIADACLHTQFIEVADILTIACEDLVLVLVFAAAGGVIDILEVVLRIRGGIVELQLAAEVQRLASAERHGVVDLENVVGGLVVVL